MKPWLPVLVENLDQGPVLAMSAVRRVARAAVFSPAGELLAGTLGSPALSARAAEEAARLAPGDCRLLTPLILERLRPAARRFWLSALDNQAQAWASWLLTMPFPEPEGPRLTRHLLSAFGPWTTPRLPEALEDQWSLLPLKPGLGRLFVLAVTWLTTLDQQGPELDEAQGLADFGLERLDSWPALTAEKLRELGLREGVRLVVTTGEHPAFLPALKDVRPAYLALAGEAETTEAPAGLFSRSLTTAQKALGLVAEMMEPQTIRKVRAAE